MPRYTRVKTNPKFIYSSLQNGPKGHKLPHTQDLAMNVYYPASRIQNSEYRIKNTEYNVQNIDFNRHVVLVARFNIVIIIIG